MTKPSEQEPTRPDPLAQLRAYGKYYPCAAVHDAAAEIERLIRKHFDLRPGAIIDRFELRRPIYRQTASYGHFGRDDLDLPWERLDKAADLRREAGLSPLRSVGS